MVLFHYSLSFDFVGLRRIRRRQWRWHRPRLEALSVSLSNNAPLVFPSQANATVNVTLTRTGTTGNVTLAVTGLPSSAAVTVQSPGATNAGTITVGAGTAPAGTYLATVTASDGAALGTAPMTLTVGATTQVTSTVTGRLQLAMSTSFQPAEWDYQFFTNHPTAVTPLGNLQPQNIRLQPVSQGIPQKTPTTWDFTMVDAITQPVLGVGDHSPEYQIALGPSFMYDASHNFVDPTYGQFAAYSSQLVQYYNTGGFTDAGGTFHKSPSPFPITWWGIYNEPNYNNVSPAQYVQLYNATVPAMQAADPTLKFVAIELGDSPTSSSSTCRPSSQNVTAPVDVVATHFYSTCNQKDTDAQLFSTIPGFASRCEIHPLADCHQARACQRAGLDHREQRERRLSRRERHEHVQSVAAVRDGQTRLQRILRGVASVAVLAGGQGRRRGALPLGLPRLMRNTANSTIKPATRVSAIGWTTGSRTCSPRLPERTCCNSRPRTPPI